MITVRLRRAFEPEDAGERRCGLCGTPGIGGAVVAETHTGDGFALGRVCAPCLDHLHGRDPEAFPSGEELTEARRLYPQPVFASVEEVERLEEAGDPSVGEA